MNWSRGYQCQPQTSPRQRPVLVPGDAPDLRDAPDIEWKAGDETCLHTVHCCPHCGSRRVIIYHSSSISALKVKMSCQKCNGEKWFSARL